MIVSVKSLSQDLTTIKTSTLDNIIKEVEKCDSLKIRYNELLKTLTTLENEIEVSTNKIIQLKSDKQLLKTEISDIKLDYVAEEKKRFNLSIQLGAQPIFLDNKFSVRPYFGIGIGATLFRF